MSHDASHQDPPVTTSPGATNSSGLSLLSRRKFLRAAGLAAAGVAAAGCGIGQPKPAPPGEKVQLVYQDWRTDWFPAMVQQMLDEFHATHPNIRVFYTQEPEGPQAIQEQTLAAMQAGTAPDVFQGCCYWFPIWAQKGYTLDLRPYIADLDQGTVDEWDPVQYRSYFTADGRQYGLPKYHGALALYYNKDIFDRYGMSYPDGSWNHGDYTQAMKRLSEDLNGDGKGDLMGSMLSLSWDRLQVHVNGWGGHFVDPQDAKKSRMAEPEALAALEWLRARMWDDKSMATSLDWQRTGPRDAFTTGRAAMVEEGSWALKAILTGAPFRIGVAPFPAGPVRRVTLATTDGFGIFAGTKHPEAAWELVKFLTGKDFGRAMARASFLQPARSSLVEDWVGFVRAEFPEKTKDMDIAAFADGHVKGYSVVQEVAAKMAEATRIAYAAWDQIFALGQAPVDIMKDASRQIEEAQQQQSERSGGKPCC